MPEPLSPALRDAIEALSRVPLLLVAMDFDGTLSPLVDVPADARALPAAAEAFAQLAALDNTVTALLSGRDLASLRAVAHPPESTLLVGSHGAERWAPERFGAGDGELRLGAEQERALDQARARMAEVSAEYPGTSLEEKPSGVVLHVRQADPAVGAAALRAARNRLDDLTGVSLLDGKEVLEASVVSADKGSALSWLREVVDADAVVFAGDDVTDEHAFAVLSGADVGIKVGHGPSGARFRIEGTGDVPALLQAVLDVRSL